MEPSASSEPITEDWCAHHFDYVSPALGANLHPTLDYMREHHPVAWTEEHGGHWLVYGYENVLKVLQDWRTFSSAHGVSPEQNPANMVTIPLPELIDPPLHREYKRLVNAWFTPAVVAAYEEQTRALVTRLIDDVIEDGRCDFMAAFARPFPGVAFFDLVLGAPPEDVPRLYQLASSVSIPGTPGAQEAWMGMAQWINDLIDSRSEGPRRHDVVDAVIHAEIEGRPITRREIVGVIQLLILGGLETTAGALGQFMIRLCNEPQIADLMRERPERIPDVVEELLRLEGPFVAIGRTAMCDTELDGHTIRAGDKVLLYFASANRDAGEFSCPAEFHLDRSSNRHITFGAGPHRCAGSNLARMNLLIALEELMPRLRDIRLDTGGEPIHFHSALNRAPLTVPIAFTPGPRSTAVSAG